MTKYISLLLVAMLCCTLALNAQQIQLPAGEASCQLLGTSRPLTDLVPYNNEQNIKAKARKVVPKGVPNFTETHPMPTPYAEQALPQNGDPLTQNSASRNFNFLIEPQIVVEGLDESRTGAVPVPDPNGDVSDNYYVQLTNTFNGGTHMVVYDLGGNQIFELENLNTLWAEFEVVGVGDPIVLWDHAAGRWVLTEFLDFAETSVMVAISDTEDPAGSWTAYRFQTPTFPDYPKYGVWSDAYYLTTNEFVDDIPIYVFDRTAMLNGEEDIAVQFFGIPKVADDEAFQVATPVDWDGQAAPPAGSPGMIVRMYDDAWDGGQDKIELWEVNIDWADAENSFLSGPNELFTAPFDATLCDNVDIFDCLPHPNGQTVSALQHVIMHRVPYTNYGTHESIALQFSVDSDGNNKAGIRWMELRKEGDAPWSIYQEGTYAPDDPHNRWMGSIAMDRNGNMLLAYSVGGLEKAFSLAFTGRLAGDPLGEMTITEYEFATGESSANINRWGDYASMSIHPGNGSEFWFTGEYRKADQWGTKIMMTRIGRDSVDVGPNQIVMPQSSGYLTDSEPLTVNIRNYGFNPQSDIEVSFSVNGSPPVTEFITDTIPPESNYQHTFNPTVDMSAIGSYEFEIYTTLPGDTILFNDTIVRAVLQLPRNDVAISSISGIDMIVCDTAALIDISIKNNGVDTLFSAIISYQLNGDPPVEIPWDGELPPGEVQVVQVLAATFQEGTNTFSASAGMPNGIPDEGLEEDGRMISFEAVFDGETIVMNVLTDFYPQETTWEIRNGSDEIIQMGGPYSEAANLFQKDICLPNSCYTLTVFDSFGDGMIGPPAGNVSITNQEGTVLAEVDGNVNFGNEISIDFCSNFECFLTLEAEVMPESAVGADDGSIIFTPINGTPDYSYSIDGGLTFQSEAIFNNLSGNSYNLVVKDNNNCKAELDNVVVPTCALSINATVNDANENAMDGSITLTVFGGGLPFSYSLDGGPFQDSNIFEGLAPGDYVITINDQQGCSTEFPVTVDVIVSTNQTRAIGQSVRLYPNPTEGFVRIEVEGLDVNRPLPIRLYSAEGKLVRHHQLPRFGSLHKGVLSLYDLPNGSYYLRFADDALPYLYKLVKQ